MRALKSFTIIEQYFAELAHLNPPCSGPTRTGRERKRQAEVNHLRVKKEQEEFQAELKRQQQDILAEQRRYKEAEASACRLPLNPASHSQNACLCRFHLLCPKTEGSFFPESDLPTKARTR